MDVVQRPECVVVFTVPSYICAFQPNTSTFSKLAVSYILFVCDDLRFANFFKFFCIANQTQDSSSTSSLIDGAINFVPVAHQPSFSHLLQYVEVCSYSLPLEMAMATTQWTLSVTCANDYFHLWHVPMIIFTCDTYQCLFPTVNMPMTVSISDMGQTIIFICDICQWLFPYLTCANDYFHLWHS